MELDRTLLDLGRAPTVEEMKAYFQKHDYTTARSPFDVSKANERQSRAYLKARDYFRQVWCKNMKKMGGKGSLKNFTVDYPVRALEKANEELIVGGVVEILENEALYEQILSLWFDSMEAPITQALGSHAQSKGVEVEELSDEDVAFVVDKIANMFLEQMSERMMQSQSVPEIMALSKEHPTHQDFDDTVIGNYSLMNFTERWTHSDTKLGAPQSLETIEEDEPEVYESAKNIFDDIGSDPEYDPERAVALKNAFLATLDEEQQEIALLRMDGCTDAEIADILGYKSHSAIVKKLKKIRELFDVFKKTNGI